MYGNTNKSGSRFAFGDGNGSRNSGGSEDGGSGGSMGDQVLNQLRAIDVVAYAKKKVAAMEALNKTTLKSKVISLDLHKKNPTLANAKPDPNLFFRDGLRKIDMVLAFEEPLPEFYPQGRRRTSIFSTGKPLLYREQQANGANVGAGPGDYKAAEGEGMQPNDVGGGDKEAPIDEDDKSFIRATYEENLRKAGLHTELEPSSESYDRKTSFLKIHVPDEAMERGAEGLGIKRPVKEYIVTYYSNAALSGFKDEDGGESGGRRNDGNGGGNNFIVRGWNWFWDTINGSMLECETIPPEPNIFKPGFIPDILDKYVLKERREHFSPIQRTQIVYQILSRVRYNNTSREEAGIQRLINKGVYLSAYPLHDGEYDYKDEATNETLMNERRLLYLEWASLRNWYRKQPLWLIRRYFGVKIGLYFAWLGFYTQMLVIPAIVGLLAFFFGIVTVGTPLNQASIEICDDDGMGSTVMCPQCDTYCPYWTLSDSCILSKVTYMFDNMATVFFSFFMVFWSTTFLELWKRRQAILQWEWDLGTEAEEDDEIRPEYETGVKTTRLNPITQKREPYVSATQKVLRISATWTIVIFMLMAVMLAVFSIIVLRLVLMAFMYERTANNAFFSQFARMIGTGFAATINAGMIEVSGWVFQIIARAITNWEHPRTQADFENSYTFKMFLFQFINYYSSLIYTAFFKNRFFTYPGDRGSRTDYFARLKTDMCDPAGCLYELCLMLSIYMVLRQLASNTMELYFPKIKNWIRKAISTYQMNTIAAAETLTNFGNNNSIPGSTISSASSARFRLGGSNKHPLLKRWEADYVLEELDRLHLFDEYIEMIIQYGFVTLFVAAFPLAPLLALINNIFEIRLDAYKYTTQMRRSLGQHVRSIGIWYGILQSMTYVSVIFNAFIIALTSDFIPRMYFLFVQSDEFSLRNYLNSTLAVYETAHWGNPANTTEYFGPNPEVMGNFTPEVCRYRAYRTPPDDPEGAYEINKTWLHVSAARLAFVAVFEHIVLVIVPLVAAAIPEVPNNLQTQLLRERQLHKEVQFQKEHDLAVQMAGSVGARRRGHDGGGDDGSGGSTGSDRRRSMAVAESLRLRTAVRREYGGGDSIDVISQE